MKEENIKQNIKALEEQLLRLVKNNDDSEIMQARIRDTTQQLKIHCRMLLKEEVE